MKRQKRDRASRAYIKDIMQVSADDQKIPALLQKLLHDRHGSPAGAKGALTNGKAIPAYPAFIKLRTSDQSAQPSTLDWNNNLRG